MAPELPLLPSEWPSSAPNGAKNGAFVNQAAHSHVFISLLAISSLLMETIQSAMLSAQEGQVKNEIVLCHKDHRSATSWEGPGKGPA